MVGPGDIASRISKPLRVDPDSGVEPLAQFSLAMAARWAGDEESARACLDGVGTRWKTRIDQALWAAAPRAGVQDRSEIAVSAGRHAGMLTVVEGEVEFAQALLRALPNDLHEEADRAYRRITDVGDQKDPYKLITKALRARWDADESAVMACVAALNYRWAKEANYLLTEYAPLPGATIGPDRHEQLALKAGRKAAHMEIQGKDPLASEMLLQGIPDFLYEAAAGEYLRQIGPSLASRRTSGIDRLISARAEVALIPSLQAPDEERDRRARCRRPDKVAYPDSLRGKAAAKEHRTRVRRTPGVKVEVYECTCGWLHVGRRRTDQR